MLVLCFSACGEDAGSEKSDSGKKDKDKVSTEEVGDIDDSDDDEAQDKEEKEEEKKAPVPSEQYVLYKMYYTDSPNYFIYEYNEKGHETKKTCYYPNGDTRVTTYEYTYNADGSYTVDDDSLGSVYREYDAKGRMVLADDGDQTTTYVYDDKDNVIEKKTVSVRGVVRSWTKTTYRENGIPEKEQYYYEDGTPARWNEYTYDEATGWVQMISYDENGEKQDEYSPYVWEYEYDEFGRLTMETKKNPERGGTFEKYTYEYDEAGGMCKKTDVTQETIYEYKPLSQCLAK
jgi:YD repeat-containing protein